MPQNSSNQSWTNSADGFVLGGGTTARTLTVTGGNATITGSGSAVITFPASTSTLATLALSETLTNKTITALLLTAGTAAAGTAPVKFASGTLLTAPVAGVVEFLTDSYYATTTTGAIRRMIVAGNTGRATAQTAAVASVATYTLGAADASFEVSANVLVTTSSGEVFTVQVTYTDEGNTARTLTLPFIILAGTTVAAINSANGAVPYEGLPVHLRCKASTAITVLTQAAGTYTGATFNCEGVIKQIA